MICVACGMQCQDFIPESFEAEEGMEALKIGGTLRSHGAKFTGPKPKKGSNIPKAETVDFLVAYQFCLQLLTKSFVVAASSNMSSDASTEYDEEHYTEQDYLHETTSSSSSSENKSRDASASRHIESISAVVKQLWTGYLDAWSRTNENITTVFDNKGVPEPLSKFEANKYPSDHPLHPSRPLLLGMKCEKINVLIVHCA